MWIQVVEILSVHGNIPVNRRVVIKDKTPPETGRVPYEKS
jgi:hypothetical protein